MDPTHGQDSQEPVNSDSHGELPFDPDIDDSSVDDPSRIEAPTRPLHLQPMALLLVFTGGVVGTLARYGIEAGIPHESPQWPVATFAINLSGAFLLGVLLEALARRGADTGVRRRCRLLAGTGFCGAFTTYSTFALEAVLLARDGRTTTAALYAIATVVLGALAAWAGIAAGSAAARRGGGS